MHAAEIEVERKAALAEAQQQLEKQHQRCHELETELARAEAERRAQEHLVTELKSALERLRKVDEIQEVK